MRSELLYRCSLEFEPPADVARGVPPEWCWPVPLSDGRTILTLAWNVGSDRSAQSTPKTIVLEISALGAAQPWRPAIGYPAPVIFHANDFDELVGHDLVKTGKLYACRPDGAHCWTLEISFRAKSPLAPEYFFEENGRLFWIAEDGTSMSAELSGAMPVNIRPTSIPRPQADEIRSPHVHVTRDNSLYILEFDGECRITRYRLHK